MTLFPSDNQNFTLNIFDFHWHIRWHLVELESSIFRRLLLGVSKTLTLDLKNSDSLVVSHPKTLDALDVSNTQNQEIKQFFAACLPQIASMKTSCLLLVNTMIQQAESPQRDRKTRGRFLCSDHKFEIITEHLHCFLIVLQV